MFFYILYRMGYLLANALPLRATYFIAERISDAQYFLFRRDRDAVAENLSVVLKRDIKDCRALARKVFRNFGLYLVDFFRMGHLDKDAVDSRVKVINTEYVDKALGENKGVIALTCHIGNWEMGGVVIALLGYNISAVALNHKHKKINDFFIRQREEKGLKVIPVNSMMRKCVSVLLKKGVLALVGDRDFTNTGELVEFFGRPTSLPKGPAMLALKTGSPVVPGFFLRDGRYSYKLIFDKPVEVRQRPGLTEDEVIKEATGEFAAIMEKYIKMYPDQWLIFRKFWETPVDAFVL
ncbi:MAG: lysophospholipid acyltransferase family protein [Candidatus Omnitrophota bacterium]